MGHGWRINGSNGLRFVANKIDLRVCEYFRRSFGDGALASDENLLSRFFSAFLFGSFQDFDRIALG